MGEFQTGSVFASRYRLGPLLGSGGMADVFQARDMARNTDVALKILKPEASKDQQAIDRLRREGEMLSKLDNPAIVSVDTFGRLPDGTLFISMELLRGETMRAMMKRGVCEPKDLTPIVTGIVAGLRAAHQSGVIHRDLKPDNIFLTPRPDGTQQVKLLDFGVSKLIGADRLTHTGQVLGTPRYMAPEQLAAEANLDHRVDIYAMGVLIYEALCGHPPFNVRTPSDLIVAILRGSVVPITNYRPGLHTDISAVISRALARAPEARYASAEALASAWLAAVPKEAPQNRAVNQTNIFGSRPDMDRPVEAISASVKTERGVSHQSGEESVVEARASRTPNKSFNLGTFGPQDMTPSNAQVPPVTRHSLPEERKPMSAASSQPTRMDRPKREKQPTPSEPVSLNDLPTRSNRTLWIAGALIAGVLSALAVVAVLQAFVKR